MNESQKRVSKKKKIKKTHTHTRTNNVLSNNQTKRTQQQSKHTQLNTAEQNRAEQRKAKQSKAQHSTACFMANAIGYGMLNNVDFMGDCYDLEGIFQIYVNTSTCSSLAYEYGTNQKQLQPIDAWYMFNPIIVANFVLIPFRAASRSVEFSHALSRYTLSLLHLVDFRANDLSLYLHKKHFKRPYLKCLKYGKVIFNPYM